MTTPMEVKNAKLTRYESEQVGQIALWKSQPPNPLDEICRLITLPWARFLERIVPDWIVVRIIDRSFAWAQAIASLETAPRKSRAFGQSGEMQPSSLADCDSRASRVSTLVRTVSLVEGAVTGAGGMVTTLIDIPLLFVLSLWTIQRIGHCYGYALDRERERQYVLAVLIIATSGSLGSKRERLDRKSLLWRRSLGPRRSRRVQISTLIE